MDKRAYLKNWDMLDDYDCDTLLEAERAKNSAESSSMNSYYLNYGGGGSKIESEYQKTWLEEHEDVKKIVDMRLALKTDAETNEDGVSADTMAIIESNVWSLSLALQKVLALG